jgi:hypothetical protein
MEFNYSGEFVKEKNINNLYFNIIADSKHIYCSQREMHMDNRNEYMLLCMDADFKPVTKILPLRKEIKNNIAFKGNNLTSTMNNCYTRRFDNSIYLLNSGKITKKYSIDFGEYTFPMKILKNEETYLDIIKEKKYVSSINEVSESENYFIFNTNIGIFVIDKKQNTVEGYETIYNSRLQLGSNNYFSIGNNPQMIASRIEASILSNVIEQSKNIPDFDNNALLELAQKVKEDDNPVLILYEYR